MTRRRRRSVLILVCGVVLAAALGLVLSAMRDTIVFFRSPTEVASQKVAPGTRFRLGGLVEAGSLKREADGKVAFSVTDTGSTVAVRYRGLLPDLFREGQGVVTEGVLEPDGTFRADTVLAKHDETYMPREVADALKAQGRWQEGGAAAQGQPGQGQPGPVSRTAVK
ncbi:cytochrome c maturation protein CcmE [Methylobacterium nonmethylotrophicum]|uniref:Cytochrome c-type biogenesis protein CcmE n=1 Tax=Methylobacterium nonmethylotrophicum TaxID=1141884 RepID=A0A4Z0NLB2_9HYPH|nr:cytochrome c maturation protein CcmE [Methylobacterium nonmethylotrophicum]TGD97225.1 cytochrome c maturation protein CcmE [Methylobacterium nonmethylotrophicum]